MPGAADTAQSPKPDSSGRQTGRRTLSRTACDTLPDSVRWKACASVSERCLMEKPIPTASGRSSKAPLSPCGLRAVVLPALVLALYKPCVQSAAVCRRELSHCVQAHTRHMVRRPGSQLCSAWNALGIVAGRPAPDISGFWFLSGVNQTAGIKLRFRA